MENDGPFMSGGSLVLNSNCLSILSELIEDEVQFLDVKVDLIHRT